MTIRHILIWQFVYFLSMILSDTLKDTLNSIYDFKQDTVAIANIKNFENYRRNYPIRYEWHHFNSSLPLPLL
jgi:erythronate-4-phosphate dehydrogenase